VIVRHLFGLEGHDPADHLAEGRRLGTVTASVAHHVIAATVSPYRLVV
jgi:hypothetical protein